MTMHEDQARLAAAFDYGRLAALLDEQEALFKRLRALSLRQRALVRDEETDELLGVLRARQGIVGELTAVGADLEPFRARWEQVLAGAPEGAAERIRVRVRSISDLAEAIAEADDQDRRSLRDRRDSLAKELAGVDQRREAVAAYGPVGARPAPRYQDREG